MIHKKNFLSFLFLIVGTLTIKAQDCQSLEARVVHNEIAEIPGETMGQKLESLLFWSQDEKERRLPIMQDIFPSIQVSNGTQTSTLEEIKNITPQWKDKTTLPS